MANGEKALADYLQNFKRGDSLSVLIGDKLSTYLKQYYVTGGMPEVVAAWCDSHDMSKVDVIQQNIINSYELDFAKHAPVKDFPKLTAIWKSIPEQLAKDLEDALEWLIGAGLVHKVCKIE